MSGRLFVRNLNPQTTEGELARFSSSSGPVTSVEIIIDRKNGRSRGFGFVDFINEEVATRALRALNGRQLNGRRLRFDWPRAERRGSRRSKGKGAGHEYGTEPRDTDKSAELYPIAGAVDYTRERDIKRRKGGRHGSDRIRGRGNRRMI